MVVSLQRTMGVYRRLKRNDGLTSVQGFSHLLRNAEEAIVGKMAPPLPGGEGSSVGWRKARSVSCSKEGSHCVAAERIGYATTARTGQTKGRFQCAKFTGSSSV